MPSFAELGLRRLNRKKVVALLGTVVAGTGVGLTGRYCGLAPQGEQLPFLETPQQKVAREFTLTLLGGDYMKALSFLPPERRGGFAPVLVQIATDVIRGCEINRVLPPVVDEVTRDSERLEKVVIMFKKMCGNVQNDAVKRYGQFADFDVYLQKRDSSKYWVHPKSIGGLEMPKE